jgi:hypothetical protein
VGKEAKRAENFLAFMKMQKSGLIVRQKGGGECKGRVMLK